MTEPGEATLPANFTLRCSAATDPLTAPAARASSSSGAIQSCLCARRAPLPDGGAAGGRRATRSTSVLVQPDCPKRRTERRPAAADRRCGLRPALVRRPRDRERESRGVLRRWALPLTLTLAAGGLALRWHSGKRSMPVVLVGRRCRSGRSEAHSVSNPTACDGPAAVVVVAPGGGRARSRCTSRTSTHRMHCPPWRC
jgi:hypothetical protein